MKKILGTVALLLVLTANAQVERTTALELSFNTAATSALLLPPYVSGVVNDPADPAAQLGIIVTIKDNNIAIPATDYTLTAASSKTSVVPNANISITKADGLATVKITPTGVGYSNITLTLTKSSSTKTLIIYYAASAASLTPADTKWHSGFGDGSAAVALDDNYMVVADDESNKLYVHPRKQSGLYVQSYYYGDLLSLTDGSAGNYKEVDVEAAVKSILYPGRSYWIGSMSNSSSFNNKPNRNRIFAVSVTGTGASTAFSYIGKVSTLRSQLITWGDNHSYNFTASAADGKDPKIIDGFNIEGMCFAPDNTTLYIAFRSPLVPVSSRTKALIAPVQNFESWFNNGTPSGNATIGTPIELNLGGRGFRDIIRLSTGMYIISAGSYDGTPNGAIYKWTGNTSDQPILLTDFSIINLNVEALLEVFENGIASRNKLQLLSDNGSSVLYNDGTESKDLSQDNFKKYRSDVLTGSQNVLPVVLQYFSLEKKENYSLLRWQLSQPEKHLSFDVQRSLNGKDFSTIAVIPSSGERSFLYKDEFCASKAWYRLKLIQNGEPAYSQVQVVDWKISKEIVLYPNPVSSGVLHINTTGKENWSVVVFNAAGKMILKDAFDNDSYFTDTHTWPKGIYLVVLSTGSKTIPERFVIN